MTSTLEKERSLVVAELAAQLPRCCSERGARGRTSTRGRRWLLNARTDPAAEAFARSHRSRQRPQLVRPLAPPPQARAEDPRATVVVLWSLLAGLFALNFTFTVFIVALPPWRRSSTPASRPHLDDGRPLLAYASPPRSSQDRDIYGHRRLYLFGLLGRWSRHC